MARNLTVSVLAALAVGVAGVAVAAVAPNITAALADKARPAADTAWQPCAWVATTSPCLAEIVSSSARSSGKRDAATLRS